MILFLLMMVGLIGQAPMDEARPSRLGITSVTPGSIFASFCQARRHQFRTNNDHHPGDDRYNNNRSTLSLCNVCNVCYVWCVCNVQSVQSVQCVAVCIPGLLVDTHIHLAVLVARCRQTSSSN
ncbi:hypothetical protein ABBQ32_002208 [Trebouxia sp. C0010 RCD-2024]